MCEYTLYLVSLIEIIIYNMLFKLLFMSIDNPDLVQREADLLFHRVSGLSSSPCSQLAIRISLLWYKGALIN